MIQLNNKLAKKDKNPSEEKPSHWVHIEEVTETSSEPIKVKQLPGFVC